MTAEWDCAGVEEGLEYALFIKGLRKESLHDNMTNAELVINMLGELATTEISKTENPEGF